MQVKSLIALFAGIHKIQRATATPNAFSSPLGDTTIHAGQTMEVTWIEPSGETVNLNLLRGDPNNMEKVVVITENLPNQGSVPWKVPVDLAPGRYSIQILANNGVSNYSPFFNIFQAVTPIKLGVTKPKKKAVRTKRGWKLF